MADEINQGREKGKGKENENEAEPVGPLPEYSGRFQDEKWFCDCKSRRRANIRTVRDVSSENYGQKFWRCSQKRKDQCRFFLWDDEADQAKEWLSKHGPPPPAPETPMSNEKRPDDPSLPKSPETPWTLSKRKPVSREVSDEDENGGPSNRNPGGRELPEFEDIDTPPRKVVKVARFSTPGQTSKHDLKGAAEFLPTPDTGNQAVDSAMNSRSQRPNAITPQPRLEHAINLTNEREYHLTKAVLNLIRSENVELKESTKIQIRHEIDMELESNESKERSYRRTISQLSARLDQLESLVQHLGGVVGLDDKIELSD